MINQIPRSSNLQANYGLANLTLKIRSKSTLVIELKSLNSEHKLRKKEKGAKTYDANEGGIELDVGEAAELGGLADYLLGLR